MLRYLDRLGKQLNELSIVWFKNTLYKLSHVPKNEQIKITQNWHKTSFISIDNISYFTVIRKKTKTCDDAYHKSLI